MKTTIHVKLEIDVDAPKSKSKAIAERSDLFRFFADCIGNAAVDRSVVLATRISLVDVPSTTQKWWRLSAVAKLVGVHPKTVYYWFRTKRIEAVPTPGGILRIREEEVRRICTDQGVSFP